jgi:hypothetical protein
MAWATALARLVRANIAATRGDRDRAAALAGEADVLFSSVDMRLCAPPHGRRGEAMAAPTAAPRSRRSTRGWPPTRSRTRRACAMLAGAMRVRAGSRSLPAEPSLTAIA